MMRDEKIITTLAIVLLILVAYLMLWPVPIKPVSWQALVAPDYTGVHAVNKKSEQGGTFNAAMLDIIEQSSTGRILEYNPANKKTRVIATGECAIRQPSRLPGQPDARIGWQNLVRFYRPPQSPGRCDGR